MSAWELPTTIEVSGQPYPIRSDYRAVLDALTAFSDDTLTDQEKARAFLEILVPDWHRLTAPQEALERLMEFINMGVAVPANQPHMPKLVDWEKDFQLIAPAVDKALGYSCRRCGYLHWWEFIGAYNNIGEGLFSQVVGIRHKKATGKKLEPHEKEFARNNPELVQLPANRVTEADEKIFEALGV